MHVEPPPIPLIESKIGEKLYKDCVEIKLHRDIMSETSDIYELNMSLFDDGKPEELLLFVRTFQMTLEAPRNLAASAKIQYLLTLVRGEVLHQLYTLSVEVGSTTSEH